MTNTMWNSPANTIDRLDSRYTVRSVAKAALLLQFLESRAGQHGVGLTEIAAHMEMSKSSTLSLLYTLKAFDLVSELDEVGHPRYRLGIGLIRLGHSATDQVTVADVCLPVLRSLSTATRLTARAAILDPQGWAIPVARVDAPDAVRLDLKLGQREWPHRSGVGKALMSAVDTATVDEILARIGMPAATKKTITSATALHAELDAVRANGFAVDDEEDAEGIVCIAATVLDPRGRPFAAISVTGVKTAELAAHVARLGEQVSKHAQLIAERLQKTL